MYLYLYLILFFKNLASSFVFSGIKILFPEGKLKFLNRLPDIFFEEQINLKNNVKVTKEFGFMKKLKYLLNFLKNLDRKKLNFGKILQ